MSNTLYDREFYNEEIKNEYLSELKSTGSMTRIFKISSAVEEFYGKDLHEFNREELRKLFFTIRPTKFNASRQYGSSVSMYIDWAIQKGYRKSINPLLSIDRAWYDQFVGDVKIYFTEEELNSFIQRCKNAQDAVIIKLRMEGVGGEASSELLNLRIQDINTENRELYLVDLDGSERYLQVSEDCINLCKRAYEQKTYLKKNGNYKKQTKSIMTNLIDSEYILRPSLTRTENFGRAEKFIIHRRLDVLSKSFNEPNLKPLNISYSGMLILARDIYLKKGTLEKVDYDAIFEVFGFKNIKDGGEQQYYRFKDEFLNAEKLKELYKI